MKNWNSKRRKWPHAIPTAFAILTISVFLIYFQNCSQTRFQLPLSGFSQGSTNTPAAIDNADVLYPPDAGVINVKTAYGAKGDGVTDDTAAIQAAISDNVGQWGHAILYFPSGTYLVSKGFKYIDNDGNWQAFFILQGQNQEDTIIKVQDSAPGFQDTKNPQAVIYTACTDPLFNDGGGNTAFLNHIMNLTINTGSGNPGAIGIDYIGSNTARISDVSIVSGDGSGLYGLSMQRGYPGPLLVKNLTVSGFNTGVILGNPQNAGLGNGINGIWFEHLSLSNQLISGIDFAYGGLSIRDLSSQNSVPAIRMSGYDTALSLVDSHLSGGTSNVSAIESGVIGTGNVPNIFLRNIQSSGYQSVVNQMGTIIQGIKISEWTSTSPLTLSGASPAQSMDLPVLETPTYTNNDFSNWANVMTFGAQSFVKGPADFDSTTAFQAAIDSGKTTIYSPPGIYFFSDTIHIRGNIKRFLALQSVFVPLPQFPPNHPLFEIDPTNSDQLFLQGFVGSGSIVNTSPRTVVITDANGFSYENTPPADGSHPGSLYLEDVQIQPCQFNNEIVYARNLDVENQDATPHITVNGGMLWALGYKTEGMHSPLIQAQGGAKVEILGQFASLYWAGVLAIPMVINNASTISILAFRTDDYCFQNVPDPAWPGQWMVAPPQATNAVTLPSDFPAVIVETIGGKTQTLYGGTYNQSPKTYGLLNGCGSSFSLFSDY